MKTGTSSNNPKLYTKAKLSPGGIIKIEYLKVIPNSVCDLKVTEYLIGFVDQLAENKAFKKKILVDIDGYHRADCSNVFGMTYPTLKARKKHMENTDRQGIVKIAFYKENINPWVKSLMSIAVKFKTCKTSLFTDRKKAIEWLKKD